MIGKAKCGQSLNCMWTELLVLLLRKKEFSLVWHYRKANPELGSVRARELKDDLLHLTANLNLGVLEGSKVIEVKMLA